jgi:ABC-2 type transport system permease protein
MNIINKGLLKLVLLPARFYENAGIDTTQLNAILSTKLLMDDRRPNALRQVQQRQKDKPVNSATIMTMVFSALMGLVFLVSFGFGDNRTTQLTLYFSFFIVMLAMSLISDFTSVLIDVRDNYIIMPKPVNDRTVVVARLLHIFIHICKLVLPMAIPGIVFIVLNVSFPAAGVFLFMVLLATLFTIFLINAIYIIILRLTTPERFKNIINYFQIGFAILVYASYQILPRMMRNLGDRNIDLSDHHFVIAAPPYWFASGFTALSRFRAIPMEWIGCCCAVVLPLLSIFIVIKYLAPSFNRKLSMISGSETAETNIKDKASGNRASSYPALLARLLTARGAENMGFLFTWKMTARSRDFKMRVYPTIGYLIVICAVGFFNVFKDKGLGSIREVLQNNPRVLLIPLYITAILLLAAVNQMIYSDKFKAAWFYFVPPVARPGDIISGALKAVSAKFYAPLVLIVIAVCLPLLGLSILPNMILAFCNVLLSTSLMVLLAFRDLPFSKQQSNAARSGNLLRSLFTMIVPGALGFFQFAVFNIFWVIVLLAALSLAASWSAVESIKKTQWQKIITRFEE